MRENGSPWAGEVEVNGRHVWVLQDRIGIVEVTDSRESLERDHPGAPVDLPDTP